MNENISVQTKIALRPFVSSRFNFGQKFLLNSSKSIDFAC